MMRTATPRPDFSTRWPPQLALLLALLLATPLPAAAVPSDAFQFRRDLVPPPAPFPAGLALVPLDARLLAETDDAWAALRLRRVGDQEVPFQVRALRGRREAVREYLIPHRQLQARVLPDNRLEIILLQTNRHDTPIAVVFDTPLKNFEKQVSIWGGNGEAWTPAAEARPIFDYSRFIDARHVRVETTPIAHDHIRIVIDGISDATPSPLTQLEQARRQGTTVREVERQEFRRQDFRIDGLRLLGRVTETLGDALIKQPYPLDAVSVRHDAAQHTTEIRFQTGRAPLTDLDILTDSPVFQRTVTLEGREIPSAEWIRLHRGEIRRLPFLASSPAATEPIRLSLPHAVRHREMRLTIADLDSPPLDIQGVTAQGETPAVVFFAEPGVAYTLFYGSDRAKAPRFDVATALRDAPTTDAALFTLGPEQPNLHFRTTAWGWWNHRGFLAVAVVLMVAVLGWVLARAARQIPPTT